MFNVFYDPQHNETVASVDGSIIYKGSATNLPANGFVAVGTDNFGLADFDNLLITAA